MEASWRSRPPVLQPLARAGEDWMEPRWEGEQWPPQGLAGRQTLVGEGGRSQEPSRAGSLEELEKTRERILL